MTSKEKEEERRGGAGPLLVRGAGPARAGRLWADLERLFGVRFSTAWVQSRGELGLALKSPGVAAALALTAGLGVSLLYSGSAPALRAEGWPGFAASPVPTPENAGLANDGINMFRGANSLPMPEAAPAPTGPAAPDAAAKDAALKDAAAKAAAGSAKESSPGTATEGSAVPGANPQEAPALASRLGAESNPRLVMGASLSGSAANSRGALAAAKAAAASAVAARTETGRAYAQRPTDSRVTRALSTARGRSRQGPTGKNAFGQLRFADNRSRTAAAAAGETSRYQAAEAFDGKTAGGGIGGAGAGAGPGTGGIGVSASPSPNVPIRSVTPREHPAPVTNGKNKTSYQQQMMMAIGLLAVSALLIAIAAMLRIAADKNPLQAPMLLGFAQMAAVIGAALGAGAGAIGMWLMSKMGQNAQGTMILAAGAALTALGAKVAIDSGQAAEALKGAGPIGEAEAAAGASAAQNIPPSFSTGAGVVDPALTTAP